MRALAPAPPDSRRRLDSRFSVLRPVSYIAGLLGGLRHDRPALGTRALAPQSVQLLERGVSVEAPFGEVATHDETGAPDAGAAMDVSDGLAGDLAKLCAASGVSAAIDAPSIPLSAAAAALLSRGAVGIETLLAGGDDYEILCTIPENRFEAFAGAAARAGVAVTSIGTVVADSSAPRFLDGEGRDIALKRLSYSHF